MQNRVKILRNALLLEHVPEDEIGQLAELVRPARLGAAETFAIRGQPSPGMVLVEEGSLEVLLESSPICSLSPGSIFSEESLVSDAPAPATLRAAVASRIGVLERAAVEEQIELMPKLWEALDRAWRHRVLAGRLYSIDLFHDLTPAARLLLADSFEELDLPGGALLAEEGKEGSAFYVIREGHALLHLPEGEEPTTVPLRVGDYVGDLSVVDAAPHTATVSAPYSLRVMKLDRAAFEAALGPLPDALEQVRAAARRRHESIL